MNTMIFRPLCLSALALGLAGCQTTTGAGALGTRPAPEAVVEVAAPGQNLGAVKVLDDNCYWYAHSNAVETTLLPLRTKRGAQICAKERAPETPPAS